MKTLYFYPLSLILALAFFAGCKDERLAYAESPAVYFNKAIVDADSINYTFGVKPLSFVTDTVYLNLKIMGLASDRDRTIGISLKNTSTAKPGYHFRLGPLVMPAGKYETKIPVYLFRRPGLKDSIVNADFVIVQSDDFQPGYSDTPLRKPRTEYKISINDQLLKPTNWDASLSPYFGSFSLVKFRFMIEATGRTVWTGLIPDGERNALISLVRIALYNYEQKNGPLIDENGSRVIIP